MRLLYFHFKNQTRPMKGTGAKRDLFSGSLAELAPMFGIRVCFENCRPLQQAVSGRPPRYAPSLFSPVGAEPPCAAEQTQHCSSFPRPTRSHAHRCSCLTRQHGAVQSGLVTLTVDLECGVRVTWATSVPILVFQGLYVLDLGPTYATDVRQTSDKSIA